MSDAPGGLVPLDYPQEQLGWEYHPTWSHAKRGAFGPVQRIGGKIYVEKARVDAYVRQRTAEKAVAAGQPSDLANQIGLGLYETLAKMHQIGKGMAALQLQFDGHLESLEADAAEAEQQGDAEKAAELRGVAEQMRVVTYGLDRTSGKFVLGLRQPDGSVVMANPEQPA